MGRSQVWVAIVRTPRRAGTRLPSGRVNADPLSVICPMCGAPPASTCIVNMVDGTRIDFNHDARIREAQRTQALRAEPTLPL